MDNDIRNTGDPYRDLATAIVLQAVEDYRKALQKIQESKHDIDAKIEADKIEKFFHSEWFEALSPLDGQYLLEQLQKEIQDMTKKCVGGAA